MKNLKVKGILFSLLATMAIAVFMTSCSEEDINIVQDAEYSTDTELDNTGFASDLRIVNVWLPASIQSQSEDAIEEFLTSLSEEDLKRYKRDYVIANFLLEKNVVDEDNIEGLKSKSLSELDLSDFLNNQQQAELQAELDKVTADALLSRWNCSYIILGSYWYYDYNLGFYVLRNVYNYTCASNTVVLFKGNNATQSVVGVLDVNYNRDINFTSNNCCPNDDARSAKLFNMKAGQRIALYDDSNPGCSGICGDWKDDWMVIMAKRNFSQRTIGSFENNVNNIDVTAVHGNGGNLDGKVSRFRARN